MVINLHLQMLDPMLDELSEMGYDIEIGLMWDEDKQQESIGFFSDTPSEEDKRWSWNCIRNILLSQNIFNRKLCCLLHFHRVGNKQLCILTFPVTIEPLFTIELPTLKKQGMVSCVYFCQNHDNQIFICIELFFQENNFKKVIQLELL